MKKYVLLLVCSLQALVLFAQNTDYKKLPNAKLNQPFYIINSRIILGGGSLKDIMPRDIKKLEIYKGDNIPARLKNIGEYGIISITTPVQIKTTAFAKIKRNAGVQGAVQFAIDGYFINTRELKIAASAINEVEVIKNTDLPQTAGGKTVINIWTLPAEARKGPKPYDNRNDPPGTIRIRGVARI